MGLGKRKLLKKKKNPFCFSLQSPPQVLVDVQAQTGPLPSSLGAGDGNVSPTPAPAEPHSALYSTHLDGSVGKCFWQMVMSLFSP